MQTKEEIAQYKKEYKEKNRDKVREYKRLWKKNKRHTDPLFKLRENFRRRTRKSFEKTRWNKHNTTSELLGCSYEELFTHIENQFTEGMTWKNQGSWHIDHIKPLSLAATEEELKELCHYTNLQPLWAEDNIKKGNSF